MAKRPQKKAHSKAELAQVLGVTRSAVGKWSEVWPFGHSGPFDVDKVRRWREAHYREQPERMEDRSGEVSDLSPLGRANLLFKTRQAQRLGLEIEEIRGDLIPREEAQRQAEAALLVFRAGLLQLPVVLADRIEAGTGDRDENETIIRRAVDALLIELEAKLSCATNPRDK